MMRKTRMRILSMLLAVIMVIFLTACKGGQNAPKDRQMERTDFALGTVITLKVFGSDDTKILDKAFARIAEIEKHMSVNIPSSDISQVNANPGKDITVHDDTFFVVQKAKHYSEISGGAFDLAILPIVKLWGIGTDELADRGYPVPTQQQIDPLLDKVNYRMVHLDEARKTVRLEKEGMGVDLGGIAKGYAADEVKRIFRELGVKSAIINMGGNVYAMGRKLDGSLWRIGVRDPRASQDVETQFAILQVADKTVVTSGDYERFFIKNGVRYHHIFDARTGKPSRSGLMSVTIITDHSVDADAMSTTVFVLGADKGLALIEKTPNAEAVAVTEDKKVYVTSGMKGKVEITNEEYKLQP